MFSTLAPLFIVATTILREGCQTEAMALKDQTAMAFRTSNQTDCFGHNQTLVLKMMKNCLEDEKLMYTVDFKCYDIFDPKVCEDFNEGMNLTLVADSECGSAKCVPRVPDPDFAARCERNVSAGRVYSVDPSGESRCICDHKHQRLIEVNGECLQEFNNFTKGICPSGHVLRKNDSVEFECVENPCPPGKYFYENECLEIKDKADCETDELFINIQNENMVEAGVCVAEPVNVRNIGDCEQDEWGYCVEAQLRFTYERANFESIRERLLLQIDKRLTVSGTEST